MPDLRFTFRLAMRALRAAPMVTALAVICLGLGIGAVTTVYSTAAAFTFHPVPMLANAEQLIVVADAPASAPTTNFTVAAATFADISTLPEFSVVAAQSNFAANVAGDDLAERAVGTRVSAGFFKLAGAKPILGRVFVADEMTPGADKVTVLSYGLWKRRFGGDSGVINRTVRINGEAWKIVGVMPREFVFPAGTQLWAPLALTPAQLADREQRGLFMMGRLAPGVTRERLDIAVHDLGNKLRAAWPKQYENRVLHAQLAEDVFGAGPRPFMVVLLGAVGFLMLIACANVANLLLVRATGRRRETGVRIALGASRTNLVLQQAAESLLIALAGGALGLVLAWWGVRATAATVPPEVLRYIPGFGQIHLDAEAFGVAIAVSVVSGLLFGIAPALAGSNVDVVTSLKDAGRGESRRSVFRRVRSALVVGEIALALVLVAGASLMVTTFRRISVAYPGFRMANVLTADVSLPEADYASDSVVVRFWDRLRDETAALAGVEAAELTTILPMSWADQRAQFYVEHEKPDRPDDVPSSGLRRVSAGYLQALDVPLVKGRWFAEGDRQDAPRVAILSERAAERLFPAGDALGRRIVTRERVYEVVGVVKDVRANPLISDKPLDVVYLPLAQTASRSVSIVIRTRNDPAMLAAPLQAVVARLDARLAAGDVTPMTRVVGATTAPQSATAQMLFASAIIALVLAAVGTYGVVSYMVGRRTQEMGVRVALGATHQNIVRLVVGDVSWLALGGVLLGVPSALALGRGMQAILFDTSPSDPLVIGGAAVLLGVVAIVAGYLPARRAAAVSPLTALRSD